jgi:hypothetical protein
LYYVFTVFASRLNGQLEDKKTVTGEFNNYSEAKIAYKYYAKQIKKWKKLDSQHVGRCTLIYTPQVNSDAIDQQSGFFGRQPKLLAETR